MRLSSSLRLAFGRLANSLFARRLLALEARELDSLLGLRLGRGFLPLALRLERLGLLALLRFERRLLLDLELEALTLRRIRLAGYLGTKRGEFRLRRLQRALALGYLGSKSARARPLG